MNREKFAWLFLPPAYDKGATTRFASLLRQSIKAQPDGQLLIAVDGGYHFFQKSKLTADVLIGDFDSLIPFPGRIPASTQVIPFPREKTATDAELAIQYALRAGAKEINLLTPQIGEADQFLGLIMGLTAVQLRRPSVKQAVKMVLWTRAERIWLVRQSREIIHGSPGSMISVVPLSAHLTLSWTGTRYDVRQLQVQRGEGRALRNEMTGKTATVEIRGEALVILRDSRV